MVRNAIPKVNAWRVLWGWSHHWFPRYNYYPDSLDIPARFYCQRLVWLWWNLQWDLNHQ